MRASFRDGRRLASDIYTTGDIGWWQRWQAASQPLSVSLNGRSSCCNNDECERAQE